MEKEELISSSEEVMTFEEILSNLMLSDELVITVAADDVEKVKRGLKNLKSKNNKQARDAGLLPDNATLEFSISPSTEEDFIDLRIFYTRKGTISVKRMIVPSGEF